MINPRIQLVHFLMLFCTTVYSRKEEILTARNLLNTIEPTHRDAKLPPGFPQLDSISTEKFDYKTSGDLIRVSANLDKSVTMFQNYVTISNVKLNFTYDKQQKNASWNVHVKGLWAIGSTILHVDIEPNGTITCYEQSIELRDIVSEFMKTENPKDIGIDVSAISFANVTLYGHIHNNMMGMQLTFNGKLSLPSLDAVNMKIVVTKYQQSDTQIYSVTEFKNIKPEKVLKKLMNQKTLNIPFFAHMLSGSDLFNTVKAEFSIAFSYSEVFYYKDSSISSDILMTVLQSHIPIGVTILCPITLSPNNMNTLPDSVKTAFVINRPAFDLLIDQKDKISVKEILKSLSTEFTAIPNGNIPEFVSDLDKAFTTHVSFDSSSTIFSIFVRLNEVVDLVPRLVLIKVTNLVLQRNIGADSKNKNWKISAKGMYNIGNSTINVQYSELSDESGKTYGLTGLGNKLSLSDVINEYDPDFFPDSESKDMIENTEIDNLTIHEVRIFSRIPKKHGTPHILITGYTNLPEWEKDIQIALLLIYTRKHWECKWASSFKKSPLSNIVQALTGFDSRDLKLLHNNHIMTTLISSPLPSFSLLPGHIITTPLLRLPVKKGLSLIALLRFPDNCGDDKMCEAASNILDTSKIYTVKGILSMDPFSLRAKISYDLHLFGKIKGLNNTLQFTIGNQSKMNIITSLQIPQSNLTFDGTIHIYKTGGLQLQMSSRRKHWIAPFGLKMLSFENLKLVTFFKSEIDLQTLKLIGQVKMGVEGNGTELEAPLKLDYNPTAPNASFFYANFSNIVLDKLLSAFLIKIKLPTVLEESDFPSGLMLSYSGKVPKSSCKLHGEINIFGRILNCQIMIKQNKHITMETENSPAPVIFAKGQIIIQQDIKTNLRGPKIIAKINSRNADVITKGFVKVLGIESDVDISLHNKNIKFSVTGKLMEYKETTLTAYSTGSTDSFQVYGCLGDVALQVQLLLLQIIAKSANQSIINMKRAEENYMSAQKYFETADQEEADVRSHRESARAFYEQHLLEYGRYEVKANDTCIAPKCQLKCFGCPKLNKCCRLDIFGHCIACSSWKKCCWKNINPLCISKNDGCHVIRTVAEKDLAEKEAQIIQQRIILDNLDQHLTKTEINKGKHQAVLEAAIDAKQIVAEDSSPGLNAADAIKNFGSPFGWAKINSVCYNASMEQAATGCMNFEVSSQLFHQHEKNISIWSCIKEDLITEITESLANYIFPEIIDITSDSVSDVTSLLNGQQTSVKPKDPFAHSASSTTIAPVDDTPEVVVETIDDVPDASSIGNAQTGPNSHNSAEQSNNNNENVEIVGAQQENNLNGNDDSINKKLNKYPTTSIGDGLMGTDIMTTRVNKNVPPNYISPNGTSQLQLIDSKKISNLILSSGSGVGSGINQVDGKLKELYDNKTGAETLGEDNEGDDGDKDQYKGDIETEKEKLLADEIVEDEEEEEDEKGKTMKHTPGNISKTNKNKQDKNILELNKNKYTTTNKTNKPSAPHTPYKYRKTNTTNKNTKYAGQQTLTTGTQKLKRKRLRRSVENIIHAAPFTGPTNRILFANPFWDVKSDRSITSTRSNIPVQPHRQTLMSGMIRKRWKIPDNSTGRCHIFHQLIAICKDMAETIVMLDKSLKTARSKFLEEDKDVYLELFETEDFLEIAGKRVNISSSVMEQAEKTLSVVRQGVNIWSKRCSNEFDWQNQSGVQAWLQAMDLRIQQLGGFGVYRFLENLFHAFEALFEVLTYSDSNTADDAISLLQRIRRVSKNFDKVFKHKLSITQSRVHANEILKELADLRKGSIFC